MASSIHFLIVTLPSFPDGRGCIHIRATFSSWCSNKGWIIYLFASIFWTRGIIMSLAVGSARSSDCAASSMALRNSLARSSRTVRWLVVRLYRFIRCAAVMISLRGTPSEPTSRPGPSSTGLEAPVPTRQRFFCESSSFESEPCGRSSLKFYFWESYSARRSSSSPSSSIKASSSDVF